jgi:tetratricopeptide (TPR) repeat protein
LSEERPWLPVAIEALISWPEAPDQAVESLRTAVAHSSKESELRWKAALVELLLILGRYEELLEAAENVLPTNLETGDRIAIELDSLEAIEEIQGGEMAEAGWQRLLEFIDQDDDQKQRAVVWQRRMRALFMRGDLTAAIAVGGDAAEAWSRVEGADQQAAQTLFDIQSAAMLLGQPPPGIELRAMASGASGTAETPASIGERLQTRAVDARMQGKLPDALQAFALSLLTHRRVGNFQAEHLIYEQLGSLYSEAARPAKALSMFIAAGKAKDAIDAAKAVSGPGIAEVAGTTGTYWQRDVIYRVLGRHGRRLPEGKATAIVEKVIAEAAEPPRGPFAPQPAISARLALAQILFALPEHRLKPAVDQLRDEVSNPSDIETLRAACEALILATNVGLVDESELLIEGYLEDASLRNISSLWVAERLELRPELRDRVRAAATEGSRDALEALAASDLIAGDEDVEAVADEVISGAAARENIEEQVEGGHVHTSIGVGVDYQGVAIIAGAANEEKREAFIGRLLHTLSDDREPIINRASAANAVFNLANHVSAGRAEEIAESLRRIAAGGYAVSNVDEEAAASQDPLSRFRIGLGAPEELRASALEAWARLVAKHGLNTAELEREIEAGFRSVSPQLLRGALKALAAVPVLLPPVPLERFLNEEEMSVRIAAVEAIAARHSLEDLDLLPALLKDPAVALRLTLLSRARADGPAASEEVLRSLLDDEDGYVRGMAADALRGF